jgi:predicted benzoate:H+ symporter BenE
MSDVSLFGLAKQVAWMQTIGYNLVRAFFAGIVLFLIATIFSGTPSKMYPLLLLPLFYVWFIPITFIADFLQKRGVPYAALLVGIFALIIAFGDPIIYAIKKLKSELVPIENPKLFSRIFVIFLMKEESNLI